MKPPYKVLVYEHLHKLYNKRLLYIPTAKIVANMGQGYYKTYRALRALEALGVLQRKSSHSGWRPAPLAAAAYGVLLRNYRRAHDYISAQTIGIQLNTNDRTIREELVKLETAGIVQRAGSRGGWKPVRTIQAPAITNLIDTLNDLYNKHRATIPTIAIATALDVHPSHARRHLAHYHEQGIIKRTGYFSGWLPITA